MDHQIREIRENEYSILSDFLYEAIYIPEGMEKPPKSIIEQPELQVYIADFGKADDWCLVAEVKEKIVGAVWTITDISMIKRLPLPYRSMRNIGIWG